MAKQNIKSKRGFTIIEVVLVLAIAGLIFLMVFVALPALQRNQRDTQRRDDMARFIAQLAQFQTNNNGNVPDLSLGGYNLFISNYLEAGGDTFNDPSTGEAYDIVEVRDCSDADTPCQQLSTDDLMGQITIYSNATCEGETPVFIQGNRKIALTINLEGAGIYCGHN